MNVTARRANARTCAAVQVLLVVPALLAAPMIVAGEVEAARTEAAAAPTPGAISAETSAPATARPLDLTLGELRSFMAPREWFTALPSDVDEVIVRGRRKPGEIPDRKQVPQGLGGLLWGVRNPTEAWRLLVPDPNVKIPPRDIDSPQEPPGAYRTRIGEPGKIY